MPSHGSLRYSFSGCGAGCLRQQRIWRSHGDLRLGRFDLRLVIEYPSHALFVECVLPLGDDTVATPLPTRLVSARASDMKRSTPRISAMLATGMVPTDASVAASTMKPDAGDAGRALRGQQQHADDAELLPEASGRCSVACARKIAAMVR